MKATVRSLVAGLTLLASCGGEDENGASGRSSAPPAPETGPAGAVTVPLGDENDSGVSGTATLAPGGGATSVTIELGSRDGRYRAHVHDVSCERYRRMNDFSAQLATLTEGLTSVTAGRSESELMEPLPTYTRSGFSINVHEFDSPYPVVACGDLSAP